MNIVEKKLSEIIPYEKNPRRNDEAVKYVAESIKQFGFKVPVVIDKDNIIVAGHTRYKAAKKLSLDNIPCIIADDLTDEQIKAFRLADNKTGEMAEWDFELLNSELSELDFDMGDFGFYAMADSEEFDHLFDESENGKTESGKEKDDEPAEWKVVISAETKEEAEQIMEDLQEQGYECEVTR